MALTKVTNDLQDALAADQPTITSTGTLTNFTSTGIDDNATSTAITIDASENVGIGTSPENNLHIKGTASTSTTLQLESSTSQYAPVLLFDGVVGASADYLLGSIEASWDTHTNKVAAIRFESGDDTTNKDNGLISFWTSDASSTLEERMRVDSSGNVGIGTSSPATALDARGGVNSAHATFSGQAGRGLLLETEATTNNDDTVVYNAQTSTGQHSFETNGTKRMTIDSSGRVTQPYQPSFRAYLTASASVSSVVLWSGTFHNTGSNFSLSTGRFTAPVAGLYQFSYYYLSQNAQSQVNAMLRINAAGNVGIRTRSSSATGHKTTSASMSVYLSSGDYVDIFNDAGAAVYGDGSYTWSGFSGYLIG